MVLLLNTFFLNSPVTYDGRVVKITVKLWASLPLKVMENHFAISHD